VTNFDIFKKYSELRDSGIPDEQARAFVNFVLEILYRDITNINASFNREINVIKEDIKRLEKLLK
jgi:hypothetical protein